MEGPNEIRVILENFDKMIIGSVQREKGNTRSIFKKKPGLCWYNYFSGDNVFDHSGKKVCGMLSTVRNYCLIKGVPAQHTHKNGKNPINLVAKC